MTAWTCAEEEYWEKDGVYEAARQEERRETTEKIQGYIKGRRAGGSCERR